MNERTENVYENKGSQWMAGLRHRSVTANDRAVNSEKMLKSWERTQ
jgi:hypothetical protein